jgi:hypothetical protein
VSTIPHPTCTCGHPRCEHAYVVTDGPCGARSDGCQKYHHDCLRDRVDGEQHCLTCHEQGHTYVAHFGFLGLEPRIDTGALVEVTPDLQTTERQS